jgi:hypothetical protein
MDVTMRQKQRLEQEPAETVVKEIRQATRKHYSAEERRAKDPHRAQGSARRR